MEKITGRVKDLARCHGAGAVGIVTTGMLTGSGVIVENPDGSRKAVSAEEAKNRLTAMDPKTRVLYKKV